MCVICHLGSTLDDLEIMDISDDESPQSKPIKAKSSKDKSSSTTQICLTDGSPRRGVKNKKQTIDMSDGGKYFNT